MTNEEIIKRADQLMFDSLIKLDRVKQTAARIIAASKRQIKLERELRGENDR